MVDTQSLKADGVIDYCNLTLFKETGTMTKDFIDALVTIGTQKLATGRAADEFSKVLVDWDTSIPDSLATAKSDGMLEEKIKDDVKQLTKIARCLYLRLQVCGNSYRNLRRIKSQRPDRPQAKRPTRNPFQQRPAASCTR